MSEEQPNADVREFFLYIKIDRVVTFSSLDNTDKFSDYC